MAGAETASITALGSVSLTSSGDFSSPWSEGHSKRRTFGSIVAEGSVSPLSDAQPKRRTFGGLSVEDSMGTSGSGWVSSLSEDSSKGIAVASFSTGGSAGVSPMV